MVSRDWDSKDWKCCAAPPTHTAYAVNEVTADLRKAGQRAQLISLAPPVGGILDYISRLQDIAVPGALVAESAFHDLGHLKQILDTKRYALFPRIGNMRAFYKLT